jgi:flagellar FliL protein
VAKKAKVPKEPKGEGGKKGRGMLQVIVLAALLLGGAKVLGIGGGGGGAAAHEATEPVATTTTTEAAGPVVALDSLTLNIADGHYLKVGLAFEQSTEKGGGGHGEAAAGTDPKSEWARALDTAIQVLGARTYQQLVTPDGRAAAKGDLEHQLVETYHGSIKRVFFTEFVLQ